MDTTSANLALPSATIIDLEEVCRLAAQGTKPPPGLERRIRESAKRITETIQKQHGIVEIGAGIIREMRDAG